MLEDLLAVYFIQTSGSALSNTYNINNYLLCCVKFFITNGHKHFNTNVIFNSYIMGISGLPDIYTQSQRAAGLRAEGVYIR